MTLTDYLYYIILPILAFSVLLIVYRFIKGPSIADKIIALDVIAFLSTVAFSYYLEKRNRKK